MTVKEFISTLQQIDEEINYGAHPKLCEDNLRIIDSDCNIVDIVEIEPQMTGGCGCWYGVNIIVKTDDEKMKLVTEILNVVEWMDTGNNTKQCPICSAEIYFDAERNKLVNKHFVTCPFHKLQIL